jgi:hypothetical protein
MCNACPLTPPPLKNRQTRLNSNPTFPSTSLFTNPKPRTDRGRRIAKGITAALNLSSGYQTPLRFLRHLITVRSETRPTMADPTVIEEGYGLSESEWKRFTTNPCYQRPQVRGRHQLTPRWLCDNEGPFSKL